VHCVGYFCYGKGFSTKYSIGKFQEILSQHPNFYKKSDIKDTLQKQMHTYLHIWVYGKGADLSGRAV
jgi:hypothetical protein